MSALPERSKSPKTGAERASLTAVTKQMLDELNEAGHGDQSPNWLVLRMEQLAGLEPEEMK